MNDVKQSSLFGLNSLEDQVIATKVGNMGIILTRRYLLYIVMCLMAACSIYGFIRVENSLHQRVITKTTWEEYLKDCGYPEYKKNPRIAYRKFDMFHFGRSIQWEGYVVRVNLNEDDPLSMRYHSV